ncbi:MAG: hypothetical protein ACREDS_15370, partial [Limisphaerales bacterium]
LNNGAILSSTEDKMMGRKCYPKRYGRIKNPSRRPTPTGRKDFFAEQRPIGVKTTAKSRPIRDQSATNSRPVSNQTTSKQQPAFSHE